LSRERPPVRVDVTTASATSTLWIGEGTITELPALLDAHHVGRRRFVVSSPVIWRLHGEQLQRALGTPIEPILVADGERYKNLQSVARIYDALIRGNADRGSVLLALGGGVIGDTAGFAAATYLRGITLVQMPTTLLAQVDSSVGGKVGVNLPVGKNLVGRFSSAGRRHHRPAAAQDTTAPGVPLRPLRSGEVRHDREPVAVRSHRRQHERHLRSRSRRARPGHRGVVPDQGPRRHRRRTRKRPAADSQLRAHDRPRARSGHESTADSSTARPSPYGMLGAADLAVTRGALAEETARRSHRLITTLGRCRRFGDLPIAEAMAAIKRDKKVVHGRLHFVIATAKSRDLDDDRSAAVSRSRPV
jgi:3-dehydroquinate synthase